MKLHEIPEKFANNVKKKLPETVTVKGPSGIVWDLGLTTDGDSLFFDDGWKIFALDHSLEENDLLIFKYNGLSHFDVLVFEGMALCLFHMESDTGFQTKRRNDKNPDEIVHNSFQCGLGSSPDKSANDDINTIPSKQPTMRKKKTAVTNKKMRRPGSSTTLSCSRRLGSNELCTSAGELKSEPDDFSPYPSSYQEPLTQIEKEKAVLKAQEVLNQEGFLVVMKPTHVWKRFYMAIPIAFIAKHHLIENMDIILRINERTWKTNFNYHKSCGCGGLSGDWKSFANDNHLIEHDVYVFEPSDIGGKPIVLDVHIFRVTEAPIEVQAPVSLTTRLDTF